MANHRRNEMEEEDQVSITIEDNDEISDCESECCDSNSAVTDQFGIFTRNGMRRLDEGSFEHDMIKMSLITGVGNAERVRRNTLSIVAVHKNVISHDLSRKARFVSFRTFDQAVAQKCGGNSNIRYAWYPGTKDELCEIVAHGFSRLSAPNERQRQYGGVGVHLIPPKFCWDDAISSAAVDKNGVKHMLLCRVILGKVEMVAPGSRQSHPSSTDLDTGVDNFVNPRRYIVWSAFVNSHILPCFVVSVKAPCVPSIPPRTKQQARIGDGPTSEWISFPNLMAILCKFINRPKMEMLMKCYKELTANKITRQQAVLRLRRIVGDDKLLTAVIKKYRSKMYGLAPTATTPNAQTLLL